jgi:aminoglycoside 3-N-acetyltransferase I
MEIKILKLAPGQLEEFIDLIRLLEEVFDMQNFVLPDKDHLQDLLQKDDFLVFVALSGKKIVGGLTAYTLQQYYSVRPLAYLYDLGISPEFQRRGIGRRLISGITDYCREAGMEEVFVQADEEDVHALDFYRSTGATSARVVLFNYPLNGD